MPVITVQRCPLAGIQPLRMHFLRENPVQIRYHACHERGWSDSYLLTLDGEAVGYGAVKGKDNLGDRNAVFEFYVLPAYRAHAKALFEALLAASEVRYLESQTNIPLLTELLYAYAKKISSPVLLFADERTTHWPLAEVVFRPRAPTDRPFRKSDTGSYVLDRGGQIVASGDFLLHYNPPFADLYMEVAAAHRRRGYGRLLVQELKRVCYAAGRVPAARCLSTNAASRATLLSAGFREAGQMLLGVLPHRR